MVLGRIYSGEFGDVWYPPRSHRKYRLCQNCVRRESNPRPSGAMTQTTVPHLHARVLTSWTSPLRCGEDHLHSPWRRVESGLKGALSLQIRLQRLLTRNFPHESGDREIEFTAQKKNLRERLKRPSKLFWISQWPHLLVFYP